MGKIWKKTSKEILQKNGQNENPWTQKNTKQRQPV